MRPLRVVLEAGAKVLENPQCVPAACLPVYFRSSTDNLNGLHTNEYVYEPNGALLYLCYYIQVVNLALSSTQTFRGRTNTLMGDSRQGYIEPMAHTTMGIRRGCAYQSQATRVALRVSCGYGCMCRRPSALCMILDCGSFARQLSCGLLARQVYSELRQHVRRRATKSRDPRRRGPRTFHPRTAAVDRPSGGRPSTGVDSL